MNLKDIKTLQEVARENNIPFATLQSRLKKLEEGEDYKRLGKRLPTLLSKSGVEKILGVKVEVDFKELPKEYMEGDK